MSIHIAESRAGPLHIWAIETLNRMAGDELHCDDKHDVRCGMQDKHESLASLVKEMTNTIVVSTGFELH